jgi:membrane dipeptidase
MNVWGDPAAAARHDGETIELDGWTYPLRPEPAARYFALLAEPPCCVGCLPRDPEQRVEVFAAEPVAAGSAVRLRGRWRHLPHDDGGWRWQLHEARVVAAKPAFTRRGLLAAGPLLCVAAAAPVAPAAARDAVDAAAIDMHSHAGSLIGVWRVHDNAPFTPLAAPMRAGGAAVLCLAIVPDAPALRSTADTRFEPFREPEPGELSAYGEQAFARLHALAAAEGLRLVTDAAALRAASSAAPAAIVAAEGGDFLEGDPAGVDRAYERWQLRHLQLTHYRVNELGDIQTDVPVYGGLSDVGVEVVRRCNRRGIVVDVAHGTYALVKQAAAASTKPLILSHTSLMERPPPRQRRISPDHARAVADTGGVIGVWPPLHLFPTVTALADGIARMVDVVGIDHVGIGTDMGGLIAGSCLPDYDALPSLTAALRRIGFAPADVRKVMGDNYARVFAATLG